MPSPSARNGYCRQCGLHIPLAPNAVAPQNDAPVRQSATRYKAKELINGSKVIRQCSGRAQRGVIQRERGTYNIDTFTEYPGAVRIIFDDGTRWECGNDGLQDALDSGEVVVESIPDDSGNRKFYVG